ncbi:unnamed protein product [Peronospora destructor]|nr:unnamed protein product [Peronospora destructor]
MVWNASSMNQPFDRICQYFGVKVALYFLYLGHYTKWLLYPTLVGIVTGIVKYSVPQDDYNTVFAYISPLFGAFMTIWMTIYLENWKRLNSRETLRWGTAHFSETVNLRPQPYGERNPLQAINGKVNTGDDSTSSVLDDYKYGLDCVVPRKRCPDHHHEQDLQLRINHASRPVENHRTDMEYENSLIVKTVIFQFVNNYAGFILCGVPEGRIWLLRCGAACMN